MRACLQICLLLLSVTALRAEDPLNLHTFPLREDMKLIANGAASFEGKKAAFATERGEIWILNQPDLSSEVYREYQWRKFAQGLRDPKSLQFQDESSLLVRQSVETTRVSDRDGDGVADEYFVAGSWEKPDVPSPFAGVVWLDGAEKSGVFAGQYFGGSQSGNFLSRLAVTKNDRGAHSALFVFQKGLIYPVDAMVRLSDINWLIAQSNRSDSSRTRTKFALQRAEISGVLPFEVHSIVALENGFYLTFTKPLLPDTAAATWSYGVLSMKEQRSVEIVSVTPGEDGKSVVIECEAPVPNDIYHISCEGVWSSDRDPVANPGALFQFGNSDSSSQP